MTTPSVKGRPILSSLSSISFLLETDLGIGAATGEAIADPSSFCFFLQRLAAFRTRRSAQQQSYPRPDDAQPVDLSSINLGLVQRPLHAPAEFRLKKASSLVILVFPLYFSKDLWVIGFYFFKLKFSKALIFIINPNPMSF